MPTDYDSIANEYKRAKQQPWRSFIESFTLMNLIGDLAGKSVVDLACGEGFYTRMLRLQGAKRVVGIDLSKAMIKLAQEEERKQPLGIEYQVQDARGLKLNEEFDLAIAAYLLNYARSREELTSMTQGIARCLKPGGRFVTANYNPGANYLAFPSFRKYGFELKIGGELAEGTPITWVFHLEGGSIEVENYYLGTATHEEAFRAAGFREVRWHRPQLSPLGEAAQGGDYWSDFLTDPPVIFIECLK
jgi:ubiquinone/menaquinone biosynthesis C-methylase UbiE